MPLNIDACQELKRILASKGTRNHRLNANGKEEVWNPITERWMKRKSAVDSLRRQCQKKLALKNVSLGKQRGQKNVDSIERMTIEQAKRWRANVNSVKREGREIKNPESGIMIKPDGKLARHITAVARRILGEQVPTGKPKTPKMNVPKAKTPKPAVQRGVTRNIAVIS